MYKSLMLTTSLGLFLAASIFEAQATENESGLPAEPTRQARASTTSSHEEGSFYANGLLLLEQAEQDPSKKNELLEEACSQFKHSYEAQEEEASHALYQLGVLSYEKQSMREAVSYFAKAAKRDQQEALNFLEILAPSESFALYKLGRIAEKQNKLTEAGELYRKAAIQGDEHALFHLSELYEKGQVSEKVKELIVRVLKGKEKPSLAYLMESAQKDNPKAKKKLGLKYAKGEGVKQSTQSALNYLDGLLEDPQVKDWIKEAAKTGDALAQYTFAKMHEKGTGFKASDKEALKWYTKAASGGLSEAQYSLALFYEYGRGNIPFVTLGEREKAYQVAEKWYTAALNQGHEKAEEGLLSLQEKKAALEKFNEASKNAAIFSKNRLFRKLEKSVGQSSTEWPTEFYNGAAHLTNILCLNYNEEVQQMGIHLLKELMGFAPNSQQRVILMESLVNLVSSTDFSGQEDEDKCHQLEFIARAIHATVSPSPLSAPDTIPQSLKPSILAIEDPRIELFNYVFKRDNHSYNPQRYESAVNSLVKMLREAHLPGTDQRLYDTEWSQYGNTSTLKDLLTNKGNKVTPRFANRIIKIHEILRDHFDKDIAITQLASWAAAGLHCTTRSEAETNKFYLGYISQGKTLEGEEATLELAVAKSLANLRSSLLEELVPENEIERLHQFAHLEKKVFKSLGLIGDNDQFHDRFAAIVKTRYKNMKAEDIMRAVLRSYTPEVMAEWIRKEANKAAGSSIPFAKIQERCEWQAAQKKDPAGNIVAEFYDEEDYTLTKQGAKALLYSLGYLEPDFSGE